MCFHVKDICHMSHDRRTSKGCRELVCNKLEASRRYFEFLTSLSRACLEEATVLESDLTQRGVLWPVETRFHCTFVAQELVHRTKDFSSDVKREVS
jgi:hypothetical protein